jgi:multidrug resistance efflux pump
MTPRLARCLPPLLALASAMLIPAAGEAQTLTAPGRLETTGPTMAIGSAAAGTIKEVLAHEWGHVRAGDLLVTLDCQPIEAEVQATTAQLAAAEALYDRARHGHRPAEIAVGEAAVAYSRAKAEEAQKTLDRNLSMHEGVSVTTARLLEVQRDARVAWAYLAEAQAKLDLLREGTREEEVREALARRNAAAAALANARARLDRCSIHAPADGVVADVLVAPGQYLSVQAPATLMHIVADGALRARVEVETRDLARVCREQAVTVTAEAFPNLSLKGKVEGLSPTLAPRTLAAPAAAAAREVEPLVVSLEGGVPSLPVGLPVVAHFAACPSKS